MDSSKNPLRNQDVLYRYQSLNESSKRFFTKRLLYFASPKDFNDPYDCKLIFPLLQTDEDYRIFFKRKLEEEKTIDKQAVLLSALKSVFNGPQKMAEVLEPFLGPIRKILNSLGVLCLSEEEKDILMWSHYSDGHRGYCLVLDKAALCKFGFCDKIKYRETYPTVRDFYDSTTTVRDLTFLINLTYDFVFNKSNHWEYEKEWRVVVEPRNNYNTPGSRYYEYPEELLTGIIFGCEMPPANREKFRGWLKYRKTPLKYYEAVKKDNEYGLDIKDFIFGDDD